MLQRITTAALFGLTVLMFDSVPVQAAHDHPLYRAACEYRDSVREFESLTDRSRCIDRYTETAVDRLYGVSNSLRATAKNPNNYDRVLDRYYDAVGLHQRIDVGLAASGHIDPPIAACWNIVQQRFAILGRIVEAGNVRGFGPAGFSVTPGPLVVPSPFQVAPTPYRSAPVARPSTSYRQDPFGPSPFAFPSLSTRHPSIRSYQGIAPEHSHPWGVSRSSLDRPTRQITEDHRYAAPSRSFGQRQLATPQGGLLQIGAQLMRLLD